MEDWPSVLPIWVSYRSAYENAVRRTNIAGAKAQRRVSERALEKISVSLRLSGTELPFFEYFVQELLGEGQDFFNGSYLDNGEVQQGLIRIVGGRYTVTAESTRYWRVSCQIEVRRDHD
jgi:hypothetical protein